MAPPFVFLAELLTPPHVTEDLLHVVRRALRPAYAVECELGGGGMSRLFRARDLKLDRPVIVKVLPPDLASRASAARFEREIAVTTQLQHPHIIAVLTAGAFEDILYYITPYIAGETLRQRLDRERRLPIAEALAILTEIAGAIAFAHREGVIHRDLKPENILLTHGHVCVADFGIARALHEAREQGRVTRPGSGVGTSGYMPPEQAAGRDVDARADVYALAVIAYEMLTGEIPLPGMAWLPRAPWRRPAAYRKLPAGLPHRARQAIAQGLVGDPGDRLRTVAEFQRALVLGRDPARERRRARAFAAIGALGAAVAVGAVGAAGVFGRGPAPAPGPALDSGLVLFLPFQVLGADRELGRAIPASLRTFIDGVRPLRATLRAPGSDGSGAGEPQDAQGVTEIARKIRARFAVFGEVAGAGRDSLRVIVFLVDVAKGEVVHRFEAAEDRTQAGRLMSALDRRLVAVLNTFQPLTAVRDGSFDARSSTELWWFLRGERYFRTNDEDSAEVAYREAIASGDSTVLGLRRLRTITRGTRSEWNPESMGYAIRAGALNRGLGPRDSMLVLADSLYAGIIRAPDDPRRPERIRRWFATLERAVGAYPIDPEVRYELGEARFHFGHRAGVDPESVLATLETSIALDTGFAPPYYHAIPLAMRHRSRDSALRLVQRYLAIRPNDDAHRFVAALLRPGGRGEAARMFGGMSNRDLQRLIFRLRTWPDSDRALRGVFEELDRRLASGRRPGGPSDALQTREAIHRMAFMTATLRGRLHEALRIVGGVVPTDLPGEFVSLAAFGAVGLDSAAATLDRWVAEGDVARVAHALHWWAERGDRGAIGRAAALADAVVDARARAGPRVRGGARSSPMASYVAHAGRAYLALIDGDTTNALSLLASLPDSLCAARCPPDQLVRARLLLARGRPHDADLVLRAHAPDLSFPSFGEGLWWLTRARAAAAAGDTTRARAQYALVAALWAEADPQVRHLRDEAQAGATGQLMAARDRGRASR